LPMKLKTGDENFTEMLRFRQTLGRAAITQMSKRNRAKSEEFAVAGLHKILRTLLPDSAEGLVSEFARKVIQDCVAMRDCMTTEWLAYRCIMLDSGNDANEEIAQFEGKEDSKGKVDICLFFGLERFPGAEGSRGDFIIVGRARPKVIL
jgi:hypothetical protein